MVVDVKRIFLGMTHGDVGIRTRVSFIMPNIQERIILFFRFIKTILLHKYGS